MLGSDGGEYNSLEKNGPIFAKTKLKEAHGLETCEVLMKQYYQNKYGGSILNLNLWWLR